MFRNYANLPNRIDNTVRAVSARVIEFEVQRMISKMARAFGAWRAERFGSELKKRTSQGNLAGHLAFVEEFLYRRVQATGDLFAFVRSRVETTSYNAAKSGFREPELPSKLVLRYAQFEDLEFE